MRKIKIKAVNYHLWEPCNMRCKFCFATFQDVKKTILPKGHLSKEESIEVVKKLAEFGFEKITFVGGEPTLCPWLSELIFEAKQLGLTTMIVTNGSKLSDEFLKKNQGNLDWITLSIDSLKLSTNIKIGRAISGKTPILLEKYIELIEKIKENNYRLKINTVVCSLNKDEDLSDLIEIAKPERWKVFQALNVNGQNDLNTNSLNIDEKDFNLFVNRHQSLCTFTKIIPESNDIMTGSYVMVDPAGRFFDNTRGEHHYSAPVLQIGVKDAIEQVNINEQKFFNRGGAYNWSGKKPNKITLSGKVASGKSSIGKQLSRELGFEFKSIGQTTRSLAEEKGKSIHEFQEYCNTHPKELMAIDTLFIKQNRGIENVVLDYRLGFNFIKDGFHILLDISDSLAYKRLQNANRINESHLTLKRRNELFQNQFLENYGVNYLDKKHYDLVIKIEETKSINDIVTEIKFYLNNFSHER